jgi:hypothetical protein
MVIWSTALHFVCEMVYRGTVLCHPQADGPLREPSHYAGKWLERQIMID